LTPHAEYEALGKDADERRAAYRALFATRLDPETVTELRSAVNREGITGESRFTVEIEAALQRRVQPRPRGRPRKDAGVGMAMENVNEQMSLLGESK
jgi:putative transposase